MGVQTPSREHSAQTAAWSLIDSLLGGTAEMRKAGVKYLPQQKFEKDEDYKARLEAATLYPAFSETVGSMRGRVFANQPTFSNVPDWINDEVLKDVDRAGQSIYIFLPRMFEAALTHGFCGVLVDSPEFDGIPTKQVVIRDKLHPYFTLVKAPQILGGYVEDGRLKQLRLQFLEEVENSQDRWNKTTIETVRVYERTPAGVTVEIFAQKNNQPGEEYVSRGVKKMGKLEEIPFIFYYTGFTDTFTATPPLRELAYLNAKHWLIQSAYDSICVLAMIPILTLIGAEKDTSLLVGSRAAVRIQNPDGDLKYTEHTGAAMKTGREALDKLKEEMRESGAKLLLPQASNTNKTATQASEEAQRENSPLATMVVDFEAAVLRLLQVTARWRGADLPSGVAFQLRPNLKPDFAPADTAQVLMNAQDRSLLSRETVFTEFQRRSIINDTITWKEEEQRIAKDPPGYLVMSIEAKKGNAEQTEVDPNPAQKDQVQ